MHEESDEFGFLAHAAGNAGPLDLMDEARMAAFPTELIGELNIDRLTLMDECEARFPGYGKAVLSALTTPCHFETDS